MQRCHITAWQNNCGALATRGTTRDGQSVRDSFAYNNRSELTFATVSGESYAYDYDNIGNRETAQEAADAVTAYATNSLNQYTAIGDFTPTFDDAGNQTLVKTSTGIWAVTYDADNRPTLFSNADSSTTIECTYDYMGRRATKRVTVNGSVTLHLRYIYRGYLQIACCDLTRSSHPCLWLLCWDPTQTTATRPLAIQINGTWFTYGWDLTKNICEVYGQHGYIRTAYTYSPYGAVTMSGDLIQPMQWSSEYHDTELALVYYNYRHYNPTDGRWLGRDRKEFDDWNAYVFTRGNPVEKNDILGDSIPAPNEPIFIYPYKIKNGNHIIGFVTKEDIKNFYRSAAELNRKTINNKKCYNVIVYSRGPADSKLVQDKTCDIVFIIGHGRRVEGREYVLLKDKEVCIQDLRKNGKRYTAIGCYIGGNKGETTQTYAMKQFTDAIKLLTRESDCPGKNVCIFSGPVNQ